MLGTQAGTSRRGKKKYGLLSLYVKPKGISFSKYFHTCCFARVLADFSPASTELRQSVRPRGKQYVDPACTGAVTLSDSHTRQPQASPRGPTAVCFVEWEGGLSPSLDFSLLLHRALCCSLWTQDSCSVCVYNLLFRCCWLVPSRWLLNLGLWRNQILDLLCTDGYFIWLEPPLEMLQGALIRIKSIHKKF